MIIDIYLLHQTYKTMNTTSQPTIQFEETEKLNIIADIINILTMYQKLNPEIVQHLMTQPQYEYQYQTYKPHKIDINKYNTTSRYSFVIIHTIHKNIIDYRYAFDMFKYVYNNEVINLFNKVAISFITLRLNTEDIIECIDNFLLKIKRNSTVTNAYLACINDITMSEYIDEIKISDEFKLKHDATLTSHT